MPLVALLLVTTAALASLFGPDQVQKLAGSWWFVAGWCLCGLGGLVAAVRLLRQRRPTAALAHFGLTLGIAGIFLNQTSSRGGYLFLRTGAGAKSFCLARNLERVVELPFSVRLDSLGVRTRRGFRPAPVAFVQGTAGAKDFAALLTWNRTVTVRGCRLMLSQVVEPGFLEDYELVVDEDEYLLLHNQRVRVRPGLEVSSFGFDAEGRQVGLLVNRTRQWLAVGDSAVVEGARLRLTAAHFAPAAGAIFVVNDVRLRPVLFIGFGLVLLGLLGRTIRRAEA
ncbi:MAG: hypothetical protein ABIK37_02360 [candidate division WOR-3 bacterium]